MIAVPVPADLTKSWLVETRVVVQAYDEMIADKSTPQSWEFASRIALQTKVIADQHVRFKGLNLIHLKPSSTSLNCKTGRQS
jgi:hypothetical protein